MEDLAYYNGKITRLSEMMVPFNDRSHFSVMVFMMPVLREMGLSLN